jgi:hypothetical protein
MRVPVNERYAVTATSSADGSLRRHQVPRHPHFAAPMPAGADRSPPKDLAAAARAYRTTAQTLPAGHDMMLDIAWEQTAMAIETAIAGRHARR